MATRGVRVGQDAMIRLLAALAAMGLACTQAVAGTPQFRLADGLSAEARQATGQLLAQAAGQPIIPETAARAGRTPERAEVSAWLSFLPLWDRIVQEEPDVLG